MWYVIVSLLLLLLLRVSAAAKGLIPQELTVEYLPSGPVPTNNTLPHICVDTLHPRFSWNFGGACGRQAACKFVYGENQLAYRIVVQTTALKANIAWDSGRVVSNQTLHIVFDGPNKLDSASAYVWTVSVWTAGVDGPPKFVCFTFHAAF